MDYQVRIGDKEFVFSITGSGESLTVSENGETVPVDLREVGPGAYSLLVDGEAHLLTAERIDGGITVHLDGRAYATRIGRPGEGDEGRLHEGEREVRAVMPGIVTRLLAGVGDAVGSGTPLLVLEAMKMENEARSHRAGVVETIHVQPGEAVDSGALLITLEQTE